MAAKNKILAFSIIELMVVISIVGILSTVALPSYRDYVSRSRIATGIPILDFIKTRSTDYYNTNGTWPTSVTDLDLTADAFDEAEQIEAGQFSVSTSGCPGGANYCITLQFEGDVIPDSSVTAPRLIFAVEPSASNELLIWRCTTTSAGSSSIPQKYLPGGCSVPAS